MMNRIFCFPIAVAVLVTAVACTRESGGGQEATAKAKADFERACGACHSLDVPLSKSKTLDGWKETVHRMRIKGAAVSEKDGDAIAGYLYSVKPAN